MICIAQPSRGLTAGAEVAQASKLARGSGDFDTLAPPPDFSPPPGPAGDVVPDGPPTCPSAKKTADPMATVTTPPTALIMPTCALAGGATITAAMS